MLLTLTYRGATATDLGFLLHKHPERVHEIALPHGIAHVFFPEASEEVCTAALLVELDPIGLVRDRRGPEGESGALSQYVNDRPYAASSFLAVAITRAFGTALSGRSKERAALAESALELEARIPALPCRGGTELARRLFLPLGYDVTLDEAPLDPAFPAWGTGPYRALTLRGRVRLSELLAHLVVLVPVLDDDKHYWVGDDEIEKLLRRGEGWLAGHPDKELITSRYLRHQRRLTRRALERLEQEETRDPDEASTAGDREEQSLERAQSLQGLRMRAVLEVLAQHEVTSVADAGCGEGRLVKLLLDEPRHTRVIGMDVSPVSLERADKRLDLLSMPPARRARLSLVQGSLMYRDARLEGLDAIVCVEVIEHLDLDRLPFFEASLFAAARPRVIVITTPNVEHNVRFATLAPGALRHRDHRFEWTRAQFAAWAARVADAHGYLATISLVGPDDPEVGAPTQLAVFVRGTEGA
ncbi:MAG: 3' terminal RNA ribose 2'-O-methyltransferase Hen1 [Sandaracinaceae bacterium]|nr:3' terminal RNA ribose 2'-O-methyltransferase Hen1 [Sandaracinaceae bacterium]